MKKGLEYIAQEISNYHAKVNEKQNSIVENKKRKETLDTQGDDLKAKKQTLQQKINEKTEEIRLKVALVIEPEVQAKWEQKLAEIAEADKVEAEKLAAEAERIAAEISNLQVDQNPTETQEPENTESETAPEPPSELSEEEKQKKKLKKIRKL